MTGNRCAACGLTPDHLEQLLTDAAASPDVATQQKVHRVRAALADIAGDLIRARSKRRKAGRR